MNKTIIVYFSHNGENYFSGKIQDIKEGNTKVLSKQLARLLNCDLFELQPEKEYPVEYNACTTQAKEELINQERPKFVNKIENIKEYQTIYLAYPNWWGTYPRIISSFLESYDLTGKDIYPICTHEGSGMGNSEKELKKVLKGSIVHSGLAIQGSKVHSCEAQLKKYIGGKLDE